MAWNYKLTGEWGTAYNVRIASDGTVYSTRKTKGKLERDDSINPADIVFQIQGPYANDWEIERLADSPDNGGEGEEPDEDEGETVGTEDKFLPKRR
jgi:hypothetical protein